MLCSRRTWRRERDSNPRDGYPPTHFPGVRLRPLGHLSVFSPSDIQLCIRRRTRPPRGRPNGLAIRVRLRPLGHLSVLSPSGNQLCTEGARIFQGKTEWPCHSGAPSTTRPSLRLFVHWITSCGPEAHAFPNGQGMAFWVRLRPLGLSSAVPAGPGAKGRSGPAQAGALYSCAARPQVTRTPRDAHCLRRGILSLCCAGAICKKGQVKL